MVKPGIEVNVGKSGYISTKTSDNGSLTYQEVLPTELIIGNSNLKICNKNAGLGLILDAIEKINRVPTGCFEQASATSFPIVLA